MLGVIVMLAHDIADFKPIVLHHIAKISLNEASLILNSHMPFYLVSVANPGCVETAPDYHKVLILVPPIYRTFPINFDTKLYISILKDKLGVLVLHEPSNCK